MIRQESPKARLDWSSGLAICVIRAFIETPRGIGYLSVVITKSGSNN